MFIYIGYWTYILLLLFIIINDFTKYISTAYGGLNIAQSCYPSSLMNSEDIVLLKLFVLLYAYDTIILAENEIELELALKTLCKERKKNSFSFYIDNILIKTSSI